MLSFDWSDFLNEKSMEAPEWSGRVKIHRFGFSKILNMEFPYLGDKISLNFRFGDQAKRNLLYQTFTTICDMIYVLSQFTDASSIILPEILDQSSCRNPSNTCKNYSTCKRFQPQYCNLFLLKTVLYSMNTVPVKHERDFTLAQ